jgi:CheY-like chemotaxis protein
MTVENSMATGNAWSAVRDSPFPRWHFAARSSDAEGADAPLRPPARILVAEDEYFVALANENALTDAGFTVVGIAMTAAEAIEIAGATRPDIVLMDIRLSGERDGIAAAAEILNSFSIPSLFATAQADPGTRARGEQEAQPLGWLLKPYGADALVAAVRGAVARVNQRKSQS